MQLSTLFVLLLETAPAIAGISPFRRYARSEWTPAKETGLPSLEEGGMSPVPTQAARYPDFGSAELLKKRFVMGTDTCGFAAEFKSEPWTCFKVSATCATTGSYLGCCVGESPACLSTILTTCFDFTVRPSSCGPQTLCCGSTAPSCFTWNFKTSVSPSNTYSIFNCYSTGGTGTLVDAPPGLSGSTGAGTKTQSTNLNPTTSSESSTGSTSRSSTSTGTNGGTTAGANNPPTDPPAAASNNVGAIVGGVVGGVAVLGIAGLAIFWFCFRNKKKGDPDSATIASAAAPGVGGSPPVAQPAPYYGAAYHQDPNMQQYGAPYGYYPPEQKVYGQEGYTPQNTIAPQFTGTTDGTWAHASPSPGAPPQPVQQVSELPTAPVQRHELGS